MIKTLLLLLAGAGLTLAVPLTVTVDTTGIAGAGLVDIQFNPIGTITPGTATITNFLITGGSLGSVALGPDGGAVGGGGLPGPLVIANSAFLNGILYNATFGTQVSFDVEFAGAAFTSNGLTDLSTLSVTLFGAASSLTAQADLLGGSQIDTQFSSPEVTWQQATTVPEPGTSALLVLGAVAGAFRLRRR